MMLLTLKNIVAGYGNITALKGISLSVPEGKIVTLIGANGAGKSTTMKTIMGLMKPSEGEIRFKDKSITGQKSFHIVNAGVVLVPEGRQILQNMTVRENLELGAYQRKDKAEIREDMVKVFQRFPRLLERENQFGGTLSGGEQQRVILARALTQQTECLVLDEPTNHLDIKYQLEIMDIVKSLDVTVIAAVHDLNIAAMYCDRLIAISGGKVAGIGTPRELLTAEFIKKLYGVDSRVDIEESTGRMNIVYLPRHWKEKTPQVST